MKMMRCPINGLRNINEFTFGGELQLEHELFLKADAVWAKSLFFKYNGQGFVLEWWLHQASGYWFIVERHRLSNEITRTYDPEHFFSEKMNYEKVVAASGAESS